MIQVNGIMARIMPICLNMFFPYVKIESSDEQVGRVAENRPVASHANGRPPTRATSGAME